jgi:integrase
VPRPQLAIGDYGSISYTVTADGKHVAMARFRDGDGETRRVKAQGSSKGAAAKALKAKFKERAKFGGHADLSNESTVAELAERYYASKADDDLAANTRYNIRRAIDNHIIPRMGKLRVREASAQRLSVLLSAVVAENGPGTAQTVRSTLSGMFAAAVRWGAATSNPVSFTQRPKMVHKEIRALTGPEFIAMRAHAVEVLRPRTFDERLARANGDRARMGGKDRSRTPLDAMDFLLATGCRAGEVPGLAWVDVHLDVPRPWVEIRQQVVREIGVGLMLTPTKERDVRRLLLPGFAIEMLRARQVEATGPMVFPSERGTLLAPRNLATAWKRAFEGSEWEWVTQKTLRKTVATLIDAEHGSGIAAKQLGHTSDKMTRTFYIAQSLVPLDTGSAIDMFRQQPTG